MCGSKQTSQHQSRCSSVSDPSEFIHSRVPIGLGKPEISGKFKTMKINVMGKVMGVAIP